MSAIIGIIAPLIAPTVGSAVAAFICYLIHKLVAHLSSKIKVQQINEILAAMDSFASQAVRNVEQTVVDSMKKTGKWGSQESYDAAFNAAMTALKTTAQAQLPNLVQLGVTNIDAYLKVLIEAKIKELEIKK